MKFENTQVWGFEHALRGMRNPKNSWKQSDTKEISFDDPDYDKYGGYLIGPNDMKLAQTLIKGGPEHRKFLRQIFVSVDITAPLYFFKEFDTYKVGTVANSTSTMHKIQSKRITLKSFEIDDYCPDLQLIDPISLDVRVNHFIDDLEQLRQIYLQTKDKRYWKELIRWLPCGWLQTRTVTMNYENLLAICSPGQRRFHKLNEWSGIDDNALESFIRWARTLPYAENFIFIDELETEKDKIQKLCLALGVSCKDRTAEQIIASLAEKISLHYE